MRIEGVYICNDCAELGHEILVDRGLARTVIQSRGTNNSNFIMGKLAELKLNLWLDLYMNAEDEE
ncbi:MAG TPA: hypothetical protein V6C81_27530 [Planktothrix sp.]